MKVANVRSEPADSPSRLVARLKPNVKDAVHQRSELKDRGQKGCAQRYRNTWQRGRAIGGRAPVRPCFALVGLTAGLGLQVNYQPPVRWVNVNVRGR